MISPEVRPLLRDLFQQERYEDIVEAIKLYADTKEDKKGSRDYIHEHVVMPFISNMISAKGSGFLDFRMNWENVFIAKEGKTWKDFILDHLQSERTGAFSSGMQTIKQSIQDYKNTR